jgi:hypothetical protein
MTARVVDEIDDEVAYAVLEPHFDVVRDKFATFEPVPGQDLSRVRRTRLLVDEQIRDSDRHYAGCRDDGLLIVVAPQAARLPFEQLVAILCHELGHAVDFLYPARWLAERDRPAHWVPAGTRKMGRIRRLWSERSDDQVEWSADSIAYAVTGCPIQYCGCNLVQCFDGGVRRPDGLR